MSNQSRLKKSVILMIGIGILYFTYETKISYFGDSVKIFIKFIDLNTLLRRFHFIFSSGTPEHQYFSMRSVWFWSFQSLHIIIINNNNLPNYNK